MLHAYFLPVDYRDNWVFLLHMAFDNDMVPVNNGDPLVVPYRNNKVHDPSYHIISYVDVAVKGGNSF